MSTSKTNPVYELYNKHKDNIETSKELLFSRLGKINPAIKKQVENLYHKRKEKNPVPYLGELYPWVISDLFDIDNVDEIHEISQNWLALYYFTIFTDDVIDSPSKQFVGNEMISLTALMKEGLFKLYKSVINTPYETEFENAINSVLNQGKIEEQNSNKITSKEIKVDYSAKKNDLIKLCTYSLVSLCPAPEKKKNIINFTNKLQLCFQYLDDITDIKEDFNDNNYTVILNSLLSEVGIAKIKEDNIIELLIERGILHKFIQEISGMFDDIYKLINKSRKTISKSYFINIHDNIKQLDILLNKINLKLYYNIDSLYRDEITTKIKKQINIITASS